MQILICDDSIVSRTAIRKAIQSEVGEENIKTASNGKIALDMLETYSIDLMTLDLEMPIMDGLSTIKEIRKKNKEVKIIVFSATTEAGAAKTLECLDCGADEFVQKVQGKDANESIRLIREGLWPKAKALLKGHDFSPEIKEVSRTFHKKNIELDLSPELIVIGSSTGGPNSLQTVFKNLDQELNIPIILIQHMPPVFTKQLAKMLNKISAINVVEAESGMKLERNFCYIAPGDYHLTLKKIESAYIIDLNQDAKVCYVRPSVDVTMNSVAKTFEGRCLGIVMTGMGEDGARGCIALKEHGHSVMIQDEATSVVWGMPGAVHQAGAFDKMSPLDQIAPIITKAVLNL